MASVLVFGDVQGGKLQLASYELMTIGLSVAASLGGEVDGALVGSSISDEAQSFAAAGMSKLYLIDDVQLATYQGDAYVAAAAALITEVSPDVVILPHSSDSLEWAPRLAARLDAGLVTSCTGLAVADGELTATKPICGGVVMAEYTFSKSLKMVTVAAGSAASAPPGGVAPIQQISIGSVASSVQVIETVVEDSGEGPSLRTAKIVVSGGIGVGSAENWSVIDSTAASLGAAVGATRAAVEMGWAPSSKQVGFSGLKVNAEVYIAAGISGAIHHLAGISRVKNVVAVNSDPEANIFTVAKYGVVGDIKTVLPAFVTRVNELKSK
jgi:electron transfer flavoprotein alpha subunit